MKVKNVWIYELCTVCQRRENAFRFGPLKKFNVDSFFGPRRGTQLCWVGHFMDQFGLNSNFKVMLIQINFQNIFFTTIFFLEKQK